VDYNDSAAEITHGKMNDYIGQMLSVTYKTRPEIIQKIWRCFKEKTRFKEEILYHYLTTNQDKHLLVNYGYVPPDMVIVHTEDITMRKQAESLIKKSEEKYSKAFKAFPEAITIASMTDGRYIEVNEVFLNKTGFRRDEVIGHTAAELGVWIDMSERQKYIEELSKKGFMRNFETRFKMRGGEIRYFSVSSEIIEIDGNQCHLSFTVDVTDRKQHEREKEKIIGELEQALSEVKKLSGFLPICMYCKKIRDDKDYWHEVEKYVSNHSEAQFSHGLCPDCTKKHHPNVYEKMKLNGTWNNQNTIP
jgi:PAS domain S-box-containing protein